MATVIGSKNLIMRLDDTLGVTLAAGTYTAGTILVDGGATWSLADVVAGTRAGVLLEDAVTADDGTGAIVAIGQFNTNKITFNGIQTAATIAGLLQEKGIFLHTHIKEA